MKCYAKIISVLVCTLLGSTIAVAQQSKNIYIVAKESGNAIPLATIVLNCNGKQKIVCDANGVATIATHQHTCEATISANGYEPLFTVLNTDTFFLQRKNVALQELVITGQPQKIAAEKSLYKVFTISERALKQQAAITLGDAMNNELGFYRQQDNLLGSATNLGGIGGQNIKILVNGVPVNGRENGNIDLNQVNVANAERIEIVKGPMSVLYGTDALGGVVNVITKQAKPGRQISFIGYAESINKVNTGLEMSAQKGKHSIYLNAHRNFFGGYTFTDSFNRAQLWKPKTQYTADITYSLQLKKLRLSYTPNFMWERIVNKGTPVVDPFNAFANDEHITTRRLSQVVNAELTVDSNTRITFNNSVSIYNRLRTMHAMDLANEESINAPQRTGLDTSNFVDYNFRSIGASRLDKNTSIFYGYDVNIQTATSLKLLSKSQNMSDYAVYASVPFQVTSKLQIQPAIRLSYNTKYYVPVTPSFNVKLDLPRKSILRASYAQGFRAPSLKELYLNFIDINHNVQGNTSLLPERGTHAQASIESQLFANTQGRINFTYAFYYNDISNQIALALRANTANEYLYVNVGTFRNAVQDVRLQYLSKRWNTQLGASLNSILRRDSLTSFNAVELLCRANYLIGKHNTGINFIYRYIGKQPILAVSSNNNGGFSNSYLPQQHLADFNISQAFLKERLNVQIGVRNILGVTSLAIQGSTGGGIHNHGTTQYVYPDRSVFISTRFRLASQ